MKGFFLLSIGFGATTAFAQVTMFNSTAVGNNVATRDAWLTAAGIGSPATLEDFESYAVGTSLQGSSLIGGLKITDTHASPFALVQSDAGFFGGTLPPSGNGLAMKENHTYRFDFATPTQYIGLVDLDDAGSDLRIYLSDSTFFDFLNIDTTAGSGQTGEFLGFVSTGAGITRIDYASAGGDGEWGIDNVEFNANAVPEPATMFILGGGLLALARRRRK